MITVGGMVMRCWSSTQGSGATSSGESQFYVSVRGGADALGLQATLEDLGWRLKPKVRVDSPAFNAVSGREGVSKAQHFQVWYLWVLQAVRRIRIENKQIRGGKNPVDGPTEPKNMMDMRFLSDPMNVALLVKRWQRRDWPPPRGGAMAAMHDTFVSVHAFVGCTSTCPSLSCRCVACRPHA